MIPLTLEKDAQALGRRVWWMPTLLVIAAWVVYANSLYAPFVFDDLPGVVENTTIRKLWPLSLPLSPPGEGSPLQARPVPNLTLALNYAWGRYEPVGYHLYNVAFHGLTAVMLWVVVRATLRSPALRERFGGASNWLATIIALVWTVHPLHSEAVICPAQRPEIMCAFFVLAALWAVGRGAEATGRSAGWSALAVASCLLAMTCKEVAVVIPALALAYDRAFYQSSFKECLRRRWGMYGALACCWIFLATLMWWSGGRAEAVGIGKGMGVGEYLATQAGAVVRYLRLAVFPVGQILDYGNYLEQNVLVIVATALPVVGLLGLTIWGWMKKPWVGFAGVWFFVILAPSSSFVPLVTQTIAEKRMYLPLVAVIALVVLGVYAWMGRKPEGDNAPRPARALAARFPGGNWSWGLGAAGVVVVALGALTMARGAMYMDPLRLWEDIARRLPGNHRAHNNYGMWLSNAGRLEEALKQYEISLELGPERSGAYANMGIQMKRLGKEEDAVGWFEKSFRKGPGSYVTHFNYANTLMSLNRFKEAEEQYLLAIEYKPEEFHAYHNYAILLDRMGQGDKALAVLRKAVAMQPDFSEGHYNLGNMLMSRKMWPEAVTSFDKALELDPLLYTAWNNMGNALKEMGAIKEALLAYNRALEIKGEDPEILCNVGVLLAGQKLWDPACEKFTRAIEINREYTRAYIEVAPVLMKLNQPEIARKVLETGMQLAVKQGEPGAIAEAQKRLAELFPVKEGDGQAGK